MLKVYLSVVYTDNHMRLNESKSHPSLDVHPFKFCIDWLSADIRVARWCINDRETNTDSSKTHVLKMW